MKNHKQFLFNLLSSQDVKAQIQHHFKKLLAIIPEIKPMIGFEHKHPHHHLDVWEHTLLALSLSPNNFDIRLALLLHDIGKPHSFQEDGQVRHFKGHPIKSALIAKSILLRLGYDRGYIEELCTIIKLHDNPLSENEIKNNSDLTRKIFEVQICDALAHNPEKNQKRLQYIEKTTQIFENFEKESSQD